MARKFLQMGFTRARRYANRSDGRKYDVGSRLRPLKADPEKARAAEIFRRVWERVREDPAYIAARMNHRDRVEGRTPASGSR